MLSKSHTKYITNLHHKKFREENGVFIAEGPKIIEEFLKEKSLVCREVIGLVEWIKNNPHLLVDVKYSVAEGFELEKISAMATPNQVLGVFEIPVNAAPVSYNNCITLALDCIQDPGNLGTIIRIADWFGVPQIICSNDSVDCYNPKVVQSSMGSIARVQVFYTDLHEILPEIRVKKFAAALNGSPLKTLHQLKEGVLVIGNESKGISGEVLELCDSKITIEKKGKAESLNAAVATGIILSHI